MKTYNSFSDWYKYQSTNHKKIITKLRKIVSKISPKLVESSKWGNGVWLKNDLPIIYIHTKLDHVQFGFFAGATLTDPKKLLQGSGKYVRHIRVGKIEDINESLFATMTRKAVRAPSYK